MLGQFAQQWSGEGPSQFTWPCLRSQPTCAKKISTSTASSGFPLVCCWLFNELCRVDSANAPRSEALGGFLGLFTIKIVCFTIKIVCFTTMCVSVKLCSKESSDLKQGRVALMSYHTQRSFGHEWEGKLGQFPVPASSDNQS